MVTSLTKAELSQALDGGGLKLWGVRVGVFTTKGLGEGVMVKVGDGSMVGDWVRVSVGTLSVASFDSTVRAIAVKAC